MNVKIECRNLSKSYNKNRNNIIVLNDINYKFENNKFYAIKGLSGAGKSTLIQILGLLIDYDGGDLFIDNKNIRNMNNKEKSLIRNKNIGFVFQSFYLNPLLKAYENVILPININTKLSYKEKKKLAIEILKELGLADRINHYPHELSGGEQQRVAIARALINNPAIILADEPTGSLDPANSKMILDILKKLSQNGKCVIVVSHNDDINQYADEILYINNKGLSNKVGDNIC